VLHFKPLLSQKKQSQPKRPSFVKVLQSILAGALGVQSSKQAEKDFSTNSAAPYIIGGIIFTLLFIMVIALVVSWVVRH